MFGERSEGVAKELTEAESASEPAREGSRSRDTDMAYVVCATISCSCVNVVHDVVRSCMFQRGHVSRRHCCFRGLSTLEGIRRYERG
jgi:hypothetical protein